MVAINLGQASSSSSASGTGSRPRSTPTSPRPSSRAPPPRRRPASPTHRPGLSLTRPLGLLPWSQRPREEVGGLLLEVSVVEQRYDAGMEVLGDRLQVTEVARRYNVSRLHAVRGVEVRERASALLLLGGRLPTTQARTRSRMHPCHHAQRRHGCAGHNCPGERAAPLRERRGRGGAGAIASLTMGLLGAVLGYVTTQRPFTPGTSVVELLIPAGALVAGALGIAFRHMGQAPGFERARRTHRGDRRCGPRRPGSRLRCARAVPHPDPLRPSRRAPRELATHPGRDAWLARTLGSKHPGHLGSSYPLDEGFLVCSPISRATSSVRRQEEVGDGTGSWGGIPL